MERTNKPINGVQTKSIEDGKLSIRITPKLKRDMLIYCEEHNMGSSEFVRNAISNALYGKEEKQEQEKVPFSVERVKQMIAKENDEIEKNKKILELVESLGELKQTNIDMLAKIVDSMEKRMTL